MLKSVIERFQLYRDLWRRQVAIWRWGQPTRSRGPFIPRIVFVRWDAKLGDTIVLSWVLRELKRQRPDLSISVVTNPEFEGLMRHAYGVEDVWVVDRRGDWGRVKQIARALAYSRYVVHLGAIWRPRDLYFVRMLGPEHVVGLDDALPLVDIKLGAATQGQHFSHKLVPWLEQLGVDTSKRDYWLPRMPKTSDAVSQWWPQCAVVGFCPYGASKKRHLSDQQIGFLLQTLVAKRNTRVLMIGRASDLRSLEQSLRHQPYFEALLFEPTSDVAELCEQVSRCQWVVSVDTAIVHIAAASQRPTLALYADPDLQSDNFKSWHPNNPQAIARFIKFEAGPFSPAEQAVLEADCQWLLGVEPWPLDSSS